MPEHPEELRSRWQTTAVLKRDLFSTIERGRFHTENGAVDAVLRRLDDVPPWNRWLAKELFRRECRALAKAGGLSIAPPLLLVRKHFLVRGWIDGVPLHIAKPYGDVSYFRSAKSALRLLHRAGITHNDLAKEQNWLYARGRAYLTDFQLAEFFPRRTLLFRLARYEDLRHLLKHKRRYAPNALTAAEHAHHTGVDGQRQKALLRDHARIEIHGPRGPRRPLHPASAGDCGAAARASVR